MVIPSFVSGTGPLRRHQTEGTVLGLGLSTTRDHLYRAALEGLSCQLRQAVGILSRGCESPCTGIRVVGGGSKNPLWNQIRADVCRLPVTTIEQKEATVLGASMFAFVGGGTYGSIAEAQEKMVGATQVFEPSANADAYEAVFEAYSGLPPALQSFYGRPH
jgi:L-fuculokinase